MRGKLFSVLLAVVVIMGLSACGRSVSGENESEAKGEKEPTIEEQLQILCANRETWIQSVENEDYSGIYCMVSDLNQNGRLEVVAELTCGSGSFTRNASVYEVSGDGKSLVKYDISVESPMEIDAPGSVKTDAYYDKKTGITYYAAENYTNVDGTKNGYVPGRFYLKDNQYREDYMEVHKVESKENWKITYWRKNQKISKKEYMKEMDAFYQGMERKRASFCWYLADDMLQMNEKEVKLVLGKSWKGFSVQ